MMTIALLPERKINRPAVAISFAAQAVFARPDYTEDGYKHSVEGEVTLEVMFTAAGQVLVVRVVSELGYGVDQQAIRAAQQIRFKPAQLGGQPIDSRAVVHIIFQLAS